MDDAGDVGEGVGQRCLDERVRVQICATVGMMEGGREGGSVLCALPVQRECTVRYSQQACE